MMGSSGPFFEEGPAELELVPLGDLDQKQEFAVSISSSKWISEDGSRPPRAIEVLEEGN